jgi:hypothetical protein
MAIKHSKVLPAHPLKIHETRPNRESGAKAPPARLPVPACRVKVALPSPRPATCASSRNRAARWRGLTSAAAGHRRSFDCPAGIRRCLAWRDSLIRSSCRTLATVTRPLRAILGANGARHRPTSGHAQPLSSQVNGI